MQTENKILLGMLLGVRGDLDNQLKIVSKIIGDPVFEPVINELIQSGNEYYNTDVTIAELRSGIFSYVPKTGKSYDFDKDTVLQGGGGKGVSHFMLFMFFAVLMYTLIFSTSLFRTEQDLGNKQNDMENTLVDLKLYVNNLFGDDSSLFSDLKTVIISGRDIGTSITEMTASYAIKVTGNAFECMNNNYCIDNNMKYNIEQRIASSVGLGDLFPDLIPEKLKSVQTMVENRFADRLNCGSPDKICKVYRTEIGDGKKIDIANTMLLLSGDYAVVRMENAFKGLPLMKKIGLKKTEPLLGVTIK